MKYLPAIRIRAITYSRMCLGSYPVIRRFFESTNAKLFSLDLSH